MAKKQQRASITKPLVGKWYTFTFAGGPLLGVLEEKNDKLTQLYGHAWFWMRVPADKTYTTGGHESRDVRYPVSIYDLISEQNVQ